MIELKTGIYRHYKGPLYLVLGLAHDANEEDLAYRNPDPFSKGPVMYGENEWFPFGDRDVVVYVPLQLDGAHLGPRMAVRTLADFTATVHTEDGTTCARELCDRTVGSKFADRFTYLGPELTQEMLGG